MYDPTMAFILSAIKMQMEQEQKEREKGSNAARPDLTDAKTRKSAATAKKFYDAYVAAGFNEEEAFELVLNNINVKI